MPTQYEPRNPHQVRDYSRLDPHAPLITTIEPRSNPSRSRTAAVPPSNAPGGSRFEASQQSRRRNPNHSSNPSRGPVAGATDRVMLVERGPRTPRSGQLAQPQPIQQPSVPEPSRHPSTTTVTSGGKLHSGYQVQSQPESFFTIGKVFRVWWHSPSGADIHGRLNPANVVTGRFNEPIYSTFRWMMVVKQKSGYCICCPISTYGGYGLARKPFHPSEIAAHAIVYTYRTNPISYPDEPAMVKQSIPVRLAGGVNSIEAASRVHFGKLHTVEYNVKVCEVGNVPTQYHYLVEKYARDEFEVTFRPSLPTHDTQGR